ncbi:putative RNA polymerase sigma factor [Bordetella holmesii CDC-H629-BH]|nr:putative RNA polymerase sigma factor [Bordetella holmesii CDC-H629-BH]
MSMILICVYTRRRPVTHTGFDAKAAVVVRYYRELLKFLHRSVNDSDVAADLAQESYARVLAVQQSGQAVAEPRALLYRTARNLVIDQHRRDSVRGQTVALDDDEALQPSLQPFLTAPEALEPETAAISAQNTEALLNVIGSLPLRCREAFILHKFDALPQAEVARQMGISLTMVERHIKTAMLVCRRCHEGDAAKGAR